MLPFPFALINIEKLTLETVSFLPDSDEQKLAYSGLCSKSFDTLALGI